jgi:hypothetical protein
MPGVVVRMRPSVHALTFVLNFNRVAIVAIAHGPSGRALAKPKSCGFRVPRRQDNLISKGKGEQ